MARVFYGSKLPCPVLFASKKHDRSLSMPRARRLRLPLLFTAAETRRPLLRSNQRRHWETAPCHQLPRCA